MVVFCALHDCVLGISPVTSYSGVKSSSLQQRKATSMPMSPKFGVQTVPSEETESPPTN